MGTHTADAFRNKGGQHKPRGKGERERVYTLDKRLADMPADR